jgi:hypothetical protein
MTEQKFTDEEKILSLLKVSDDVYANAKLTPEEAKALLDLFKSKNAEIERLSEDLKIQNKYWLYYWKDVFEVGMEKLKAGAIKDFADDLMAKAYLSSNWSNSERTYVVEVKDIDNLVKEMIGEQ